ncbi:response regulator [Lysobacter sp. FW306-1B-D06B]|uniref:response regulator n=1 Tax=Lysobacter sp. FW306-1B-D06B TaxID=3140250 RepID=UPI003140AA63
MNLQIVLADDHPVVLIGARAHIEGSGYGRVVATASNPTELFAALEMIKCDVLVTDLAMADPQTSDGFPMLTRIRRLYPDLPIILLSGATNIAILRAIAGLGILGIVDKCASLTELPAAIQAVHRGLSYVSTAHDQRAAAAGHTRMRYRPSQALSPREAEVLRLLSSGLTVSQVADRSRRGITTISRQKRDAMRKLGLSTDSELYDYLRSA